LRKAAQRSGKKLVPDKSGTSPGQSPHTDKDSDKTSSSGPDDVMHELLESLADLLSAGKGPKQGKEAAYLGIALERNVTKAEALEIMTQARELAAKRKFDSGQTKKLAVERAEARLREAEERSRADGDRQLGIGDQS
jgi:hypothetical protein